MDTRMILPGTGPAVWVAGDRYLTLVGGDATAGAYALIDAVVPPGGGPPPHRHHREDEAFYIIDGELHFEADGQTFTASAGAWVMLARGSRHRFQNIGTKPAHMLIVVNPSGLERYFAEVGRPATGNDEDSAPTPADLEKLIALAPRYGLEIFLSPPG